MGTVAIGHRLRWLVNWRNRIVVAAAKWRRLAVNRANGKVLPVWAGHLLGWMYGKRHTAALALTRHLRNHTQQNKDVEKNKRSGLQLNATAGATGAAAAASDAPTRLKPRKQLCGCLKRGRERQRPKQKHKGVA